MRSLLVMLVGITSVSLAADKPKPPALPDADRIRIAEAYRLADALGNRVWPDWDKAPFALLLITSDHEFLIRHPKPSDDFILVGEDDVLKSKVWYRPRKYKKDFLATFPAVGGLSTIVIGQAENTEAKTSTPWVITVLHEHFHQLQSSRPRYYADVDSLGLARGDTTGMWMLNYPFPYDTAEVQEHFSAMSQALAQALQARQKTDFDDKVTAYLKTRKKFRSALKTDDFKYFAFQVWQEGVARYTEYRLAELAAAEYKPSAEFQKLKDFQPFKDAARHLSGAMEKELEAVQLNKAKRTVVYNLGAAEGLLLDQVNPDWRKQYFKELFSLDEHFRVKK